MNVWNIELFGTCKDPYNTNINKKKFDISLIILFVDISIFNALFSPS